MPFADPLEAFIDISLEHPLYFYYIIPGPDVESRSQIQRSFLCSVRAINENPQGL